MKALTKISLVIWMIFGVANIIIGYFLIRLMIAFVTWMVMPESPPDFSRMDGSC